MNLAERLTGKTAAQREIARHPGRSIPGYKLTEAELDAAAEGEDWTQAGPARRRDRELGELWLRSAPGQPAPP